MFVLDFLKYQVVWPLPELEVECWQTCMWMAEAHSSIVFTRKVSAINCNYNTQIVTGTIVTFDGHYHKW